VAFTRKNFVSWQRVVAGQEIWSYNFSTGQASRLIAAQDSLRYSDPKWTPDGKSLASIAGGMGLGTLDNKIEVCDGSGRRCRTAATGLNLKSFAFLRDGRLIISKAEPEPNGLSCGLWITAHAGQELHRLTDWQGSCLDNLTLTSDESKLALRKPSYLGATYVAELLNNATQISKPVRFNYNKGQEGPQAWLPDNRTLLLASNQKGHWEVLKQTDADPTAQPLVSEARSTGHPAVTPDGKWILYMVGPRSLDAALYRGPVQLMRVPVMGGPSAKVTEILGSDLVQCPANGRRSCVLIRSNKEHNCLTFRAFDPLSGTGAVIASYPIEPPGPVAYALSGDGTSVAITHAANPQIDVLSLDTGAVEHLRVSSPHDWNSITWAPGDQGFFVPARSRSGIALLEMDLSGNSHILWDQRGATRTWGIPSPNGRLLAILNWTVDSNMWTVQGF
jgi:dipeptidyl aminopeptidase/acylaminoacyl peptidase